MFKNFFKSFNYFVIFVSLCYPSFKNNEAAAIINGKIEVILKTLLLLYKSYFIIFIDTLMNIHLNSLSSMYQMP